MNVSKRCELLKAMDTLARSCNNESFIDHWLTLGIADGDADNGNIDGYTDDETFAELMSVFLDCMAWAKEDGGLYVDNVLSKSEDE